MKRVIIVLLSLLLIVLSSPIGVFAHGGRTDAYGGHNQKSTGTYHFHSGSLTGQSFSSQAEAIQALNSVSTPTQKVEPASDNKTIAFVGSKKSNKYHYPTCVWAQKIKTENVIAFTGTKDAQSKGYVPCKVCNPPR